MHKSETQNTCALVSDQLQNNTHLIYYCIPSIMLCQLRIELQSAVTAPIVRDRIEAVNRSRE